MSNTEQSGKIDLDQVMLAMDVVDTLRHQQNLIERELGAEDRDRMLIEKVRKIYADQGIAVSDEIVAEGVKALREERFIYHPPEKSFQLTLARIYVNRGRWAKRGGLVLAAFLAIFLVYRFVVVVPQQRTVQQLEAMPAKLAEQRDRVLGEAREDKAREQAETIYKDAMAAVSRRDFEAAAAGSIALSKLYEDLALQYELRIVSRQGVPSGVWRVPGNNPNVRNYYIIVEAVGADGKRVSLPITSEEDGQVHTVEQWGVRVAPEVFEQVRRDKMDDGIVQRNVLGTKKRGELIPRYVIPTAGGMITQW